MAVPGRVKYDSCHLVVARTFGKVHFVISTLLRQSTIIVVSNTVFLFVTSPTLCHWCHYIPMLIAEGAANVKIKFVDRTISTYTVFLGEV